MTTIAQTVQRTLRHGIHRVKILTERTLLNPRQPRLLRMGALGLSIFFEQNRRYIGSLSNTPAFASWIAAMMGSVGGINNLGNVYTLSGKRLTVTQHIEKEVIEWNKTLIHAADKQIEGYVTSGGTEANLCIMWMGREKLSQALPNVRPVLVTSTFAHYSITKASRILDLPIICVEVDTTRWGIDTTKLRDTLTALAREGKRSILLPVTIGYSSTGTSDDLHDVLEVVKGIEKRFPEFRCFLWVDAAGQGIVKSFLEKTFTPMEDPRIQGYIVDFHKFGGSVLPSGVLLYRKDLRTYIETPIDYLRETDATISGSRPGFAPLSVWAATLKRRRAWQKHFRSLEIKKLAVMRAIQRRHPKATFINEPHSLTFAVRIDDHFKKQSAGVEGHYGLVECTIQGIRHYKFHIVNGAEQFFA